MVPKNDLQDSELYLAYKYLTEKNYIEATAISGAGQSSSHRYKITVMGIDHYEKEQLDSDKSAVIKMQNDS